MNSSLFAGFSLGFSLILAIGSQNAFVLRQGLRGQHVGMVVFTCALSDAILISVGVAGFGSMVAVVPWFEIAMRLLGGMFLTVYGARAMMSAWRGSEALDSSGGAQTGRLWPVLVTCLALTWLNPHVYLDTIVLLGAISAQYSAPLWFAVGASCASVLFFCMLGFGARYLAPLFSRPISWRILDVMIALVMWGIAFKVLLG